jgi:hypothetical protein
MIPGESETTLMDLYLEESSVKYWVLFVWLLCCIHIRGGDEVSSNPSENNQLQLNNFRNPAETQEIKLEDVLKFYIGYVENAGETGLLTIDIQELGALNEAVCFHYTINSSRKREAGVGKLDLQHGIIEFNDSLAGKIYRDNDQKIIFESLEQNNFNFWKVKEK